LEDVPRDNKNLFPIFVLWHKSMSSSNMPISPTFYVQIFCTKFWRQKSQSRMYLEKSCSICFCTKNECVKCWWHWHQHVNFSNIICVTFLYEIALHIFFVRTYFVFNFLAAEISEKAAHNKLVKWNSCVNLINILLTPFLYESAFCNFI